MGERCGFVGAVGVRRGGGRHRLRGAPVGDAEGQRRLVAWHVAVGIHRQAGVVAGHRHRDAGGRRTVQGDGVGVGRPLGHGQPGWREDHAPGEGLQDDLRHGVEAAELQHRMREGVAEVPGVVVRRFARRAVAVHVLIVPIRVDARVPHRLAQQRRGAALRRVRVVVVGDAAQARVPIARRHRAAAGDQAALGGRRAGARHRARRVAGRDVGTGLGVAHQSADHRRRARVRALHRRSRVARHDGPARVQHPHQASQVARRRHRARRPHRRCAAPALPGQRRRAPAAVHPGVRQPQRPHRRRRAQRREQADVGAAAVDEQVADHVAVAVERGREVGRVRRRCGRADRVPAVAAVVVRVAKVAGTVRVRAVVAIGVEVQVLVQLVASAAGGRAAHAGRRVVEGTLVLVLVAGRGRAVAVQVPADGVQLAQAADFDQAVVVAVIIAALQAGVMGAVIQHGVLRTGAEVPRVLARRAVPVDVQIVPVRVDAGGGRGRLQLAGRSARRAVGERCACGDRVAVVVRRRAAEAVDEASRVSIALRTAGVRGHACRVGRPDRPGTSLNQAASA